MFGGGKSSGSSDTQVKMTPEQQQMLSAQTDAFKNVFLPAYEKTIGGAQDVFTATQPYLNNAALQGYNQSTNVAKGLVDPSMQALGTSSQRLANIISPDYIQNQLSAATQPIQEQTRELRNQQTASFGGAGNLGSSRAALADANLASLDKQRQSQAVASAISNITGQQIGAAGTLGTMGFQGLGTAQGANQAAVSYANAPTDLYSKYASIMFGVPQQSTTPNFTGTQGSSSQGKSSSVGFSFS